MKIIQSTLFTYRAADVPAGRVVARAAVARAGAVAVAVRAVVQTEQLH